MLFSPHSLHECDLGSTRTECSNSETLALPPVSQKENNVQINVSGHHIDVTDSLHSYVVNKLDRLERHFDRITNVDVILSVEKQRQRAESTVWIAGGEVHAESESEDLYAAIALLSDKLDRQLIKQKEKVKDYKHRPDH